MSRFASTVLIRRGFANRCAPCEKPSADEAATSACGQHQTELGLSVVDASVVGHRCGACHEPMDMFGDNSAFYARGPANRPNLFSTNAPEQKLCCWIAPMVLTKSFKQLPGAVHAVWTCSRPPVPHVWDWGVGGRRKAPEVAAQRRPNGRFETPTSTLCSHRCRAAARLLQSVTGRERFT